MQAGDVIRYIILGPITKFSLLLLYSV